VSPRPVQAHAHAHAHAHARANYPQYEAEIDLLTVRVEQLEDEIGDEMQVRCTHGHFRFA